MYDIIIIGSGPAGLSAAIYAQRACLDTIVIEKNGISGGQVLNTWEVDNYPGMPGINGMDLGEAFGAHAAKLGLTPKREDVLSVEEEQEVKVIRTKKNEYRAKTVILAFGAAHRTLDIPGEKELGGMGVSYCATCDGAFFKDRTVAVIGGGNVAVEDAILLSRTCKEVKLIHRRDQLRADKILQEKLFSCKNVEVIWDTVPLSIEGEDMVSGLKVQNKKTGEEQALLVDGVFVAVGIVPNTDLFRNLVDLDQGGYVIAGEDCSSSLAGLFVAGDVRTKSLRQVVTAVADGAVAIQSATGYIKGME